MNNSWIFIYYIFCIWIYILNYNIEMSFCFYYSCFWYHISFKIAIRILDRLSWNYCFLYSRLIIHWSDSNQDFISGTFVFFLYKFINIPLYLINSSFLEIIEIYIINFQYRFWRDLIFFELIIYSCSYILKIYFFCFNMIRYDIYFSRYICIFETFFLGYNRNLHYQLLI